MSVLPDMYRGDYINTAVQLEDAAGNSITIDDSAAVTATFSNANASVGPVISQSKDYEGADWTNGLVIIQFTPAESNLITKVGHVDLDVTVDDEVNTPGPSTYRGPVIIGTRTG